MKNFILTALFFASFSCTTSQDAAKVEATSGLVESQDYIFTAEYAYPMTGRSIYLNSDYTFAISKDSLISYLPYFGRAYVAPINPTEGGIQFKSKEFDYSLTKNKSGWDVIIKTKDVQRRYQISLNIGTTGNATLNVNSPDRQNISFSGYIEKRK